MRRLLFTTFAIAMAASIPGGAQSPQAPVAAATDGGYKLVPNWPTLPSGEFFGLKTPPPPPAEREAQAAARRAMGQTGNAPRPAGQGPTNQPGISGLAIDKDDRIYVFNRGAKPVMVFNTDGKPVLDESGPVSIDAINAALTKVTGLKPQGDVTLSLSREVNELNSEIVASR